MYKQAMILNFRSIRILVFLKACSWYWWFLRSENYPLRDDDSTPRKVFYSGHNTIHEAPRAQGLLSLFLQVRIQCTVGCLPHNSGLNEMLNELIMFLLLNCNHFLMFSIKGYMQIMFNFPDFEVSSSMYGFSLVLT